MLKRSRSSVIILLPPPYFCSSMFCDIVKGLGLTCTCIALGLSSLRGSRELGKRTRKARVSVGVSGVFRGSSSIGTSVDKGMLLL
jgi:hypothetical protein